MPKSIQEEIFFDGSSYFDALIKDLEKAQTSIDIETYIFKFDELGKKILSALEQCAKRNVKTRILVDGAGTPKWGGNLINRLEKAGGETRIFHPFPWRLWQWSHSVVRVPVILKAIYLFLKINSRNHRKTCVIDTNIIYVGSFNIDKCHLTKDKLGDGWRDAGIRLANVDINPLKQAFDAAWNHAPIQERIRQIFKHVQTNPIIRLNNTRHRRRILYKNLLRRIKSCKNRIWITNAYFVPDKFLLKALKDAARSGIDVRILLPRKSDVLFMPWASATFYESLLKSGVRIFEYLPSMLHAKTLILDDWISVGSSNLNHRSLLHDLEIDINTRRLESKQLIEKQFLQDLENAKEINSASLEKRRFYQRIIGNLSLYAKYLI
jgi:cardiolipin synthase A/B